MALKRPKLSVNIKARILYGEKFFFCAFVNQYVLLRTCMPFYGVERIKNQTMFF